MGKVFRGEEFNPYPENATIFWRWEAERNAAELEWYRYDLIPRFTGSGPKVGTSLTGRRYGEIDDRPLRRAERRVAELEDWIDNHHEVVDAPCDGVMCLVDEDDLKEIFDA
jgi:hypothetical protein